MKWNSVWLEMCGRLMFWTRRLIVFGLFGLLVNWSGCNRTPGSDSLVFPELVKANSLLLSEIETAGRDSSVIRCPIKVDNPNASPVTFKLVKTGCSCYGVRLHGERIQRGEEIEVAGSSSLLLNIDAQPPITETLQDYQIQFEYLSANGELKQADVRCELQVYNDLKTLPKVMICDTEAGVDKTQEKELTIERIFRSATGSCAEPVLEGLPESVSSVQIESLGEANELESGIWKRNWLASFQVQVEGSLSAQGVSDRYQVRFPGNQKENQSGVTENQLIRRVRVPVLFPQKIQFGKIQTGQIRKRTLFVRHLEDKDFLLKIDESKLPENVQVSIPRSPASRYLIEVEIEAKGTGEWAEILPLTTNLEKQPRIDISLSAIFKSPEND